MKRTISILFLFLLLSFCFLFEFCNNNAKKRNINLSFSNDTTNIIVYIKDSSLFIYNQLKDSNIFVKNIENGFILYSTESINDSIVIIGYSGNSTDSAFNKKTGKPMKCPSVECDSFIIRGVVGSEDYKQFTYYSNTYKAINIYTKVMWIFKIIDYKYSGHNDSTREARINYFDRHGKIIAKKDWVNLCQQEWILSGMDEYGDFEMSTKCVNGRQIIASGGNLYLRKKDTTEILLQNEHPRQRDKCSNGYYEPDLSPDGNTVVYRKMAGDIEIYPCKTPPKDSGIFEMDIATKEIEELVPQNASYPIYSPGGRFILFLRNRKECKNNALVYEINIFDRLSRKWKAIGIGDNYVWMRPKKKS
jgi:hypothetical protein